MTMSTRTDADTATIDQTGMRDVDALIALYDLRDVARVRDYLLANEDLVRVLHELPDRVAPYLPISDRLVLELVLDPEQEEAAGGLYALVPVRLDPVQALAGLARMRRAWWLDTYRETGGRLNVDVEFR